MQHHAVNLSGDKLEVISSQGFECYYTRLTIGYPVPHGVHDGDMSSSVLDSKRKAANVKYF